LGLYYMLGLVDPPDELPIPQVSQQKETFAKKMVNKILKREVS